MKSISNILIRMPDCAREESLLSRRIWLESGKPNVGVEYDNMKQCRASYHYLLRSLKTKIRDFFIGGAGGALPPLKLVQIWYMY